MIQDVWNLKYEYYTSGKIWQKALWNPIIQGTMQKNAIMIFFSVCNK